MEAFSFAGCRNYAGPGGHPWRVQGSALTAGGACREAASSKREGIGLVLQRQGDV